MGLRGEASSPRRPREARAARRHPKQLNSDQTRLNRLRRVFFIVPRSAHTTSKAIIFCPSLSLSPVFLYRILVETGQPVIYWRISFPFVSK